MADVPERATVVPYMRTASEGRDALEAPPAGHELDSLARLRAVLDAALDAIVTMDERGIVVDVNRAALRTFGFPLEEFVGRPLAETIVPPALRDQHRAGLARYLETGEERVLGRRLELTAVRADGSELPVEVSILRVDVPGPPLFTGFIRDIGERVRGQAELMRAHRELAEHAAELERRVDERTRHLVELNAELESFAYSVSHDLRAPLRAMDGFSQIVLEEHAGELSEDARSYLSRIREGVRRMGDLIDDLLAFSRLGRLPLHVRRVDPVGVARDALAELGPEGARWVTFGDLPPCRADPSLLKQVFLNLLDNAIKFTRDRPDPRVEVGSRAGSGDAVVYFVGDNGVGFDMAYADRVFGVFQRLHERERYEGTGVGLALVQRIVHRHGGRIWVDAAPDRGATFSFTLEGGTDDSFSGWCPGDPPRGG